MSERIITLQKNAIIDFTGLDNKLNELSTKFNKYDMSLPITKAEDNTALKKIVADIRKDWTYINSEKIALKKAVLVPFDVVDNKLKDFKLDLDTKLEIALNNISIFEEQERLELEEELKEYFDRENKHDFIKFETLNIKVNRSSSMNKLKDEVNAFLSKIETDVLLIMTQPNNLRIMSEYERTLQASNSILKVNEQVAREQELSLKINEEVDDIYSPSKIEVDNHLIADIGYNINVDTPYNNERVKKYRGEISCTKSQYVMLQNICLQNGIEINLKEQLS